MDINKVMKYGIITLACGATGVLIWLIWIIRSKYIG